MADRVETLADSVAQLTSLVRDEMHTVNATASALHTTLASATTPTSDWAALLLSRILSTFLDSQYGTHVRHVLDLATFKVFLLLGRTIFHMLCSWPMVLLVVCVLSLLCLTASASQGMALLCMSVFRRSTQAQNSHVQPSRRSRIHCAEHSLMERRDGRRRDEGHRGRIHSVAGSFAY